MTTDNNTNRELLENMSGDELWGMNSVIFWRTCLESTPHHILQMDSNFTNPHHILQMDSNFTNPHHILQGHSNFTNPHTSNLLFPCFMDIDCFLMVASQV